MKKFIISFLMLIVAALSLHAQYEVDRGDSKVVVTGQDGKQIVNVVDEPQSDRIMVEVLGMSLQLRNGGRNGDDRPIQKPKYNPHGGHLSLFELGYNYIQFPDYYNLDIIGADNYGFLECKNWKSANIAITYGNLSFDIEREGLVSLTIGLQGVFNFYMLPKNIRLEKQKGMIVPVKVDTPYKNSYIANVAYRIPVIFEFNDVPYILGAKHRSKWFFSVGMHIDYVFSSAVTRKPNTNVRNLYTNPIQAGLNTRLGWGNYYIYATANISNMFKDGRGPMFNHSTVGVGFLF